MPTACYGGSLQSRLYVYAKIGIKNETANYAAVKSEEGVWVVIALR